MIPNMVRPFELLVESAMANRIQFKVVFSGAHYPHTSVSKCLRLILEQRKEQARDGQRYVKGTLSVEQEDANECHGILGLIQKEA